MSNTTESAFHHPEPPRPYTCRCGSRCTTPESLVGHLEVHNTSHGPYSPEAVAALVRYGTSWRVRKTQEG